MRPFPPCGGRWGWGAPRSKVDAFPLLQARVAVAVPPPIQLRLGSLRSPTLRILPPQGGKDCLCAFVSLWFKATHTLFLPRFDELPEAVEEVVAVLGAGGGFGEIGRGACGERG